LSRIDTRNSKHALDKGIEQRDETTNRVRIRLSEKLPERNRKRNPLTSGDDRKASGFRFDERPPAVLAGRRHNVRRVAHSFYDDFIPNRRKHGTRSDRIHGPDDLTFYTHIHHRICVVLMTTTILTVVIRQINKIISAIPDCQQNTYLLNRRTCHFLTFISRNSILHRTNENYYR